MANPANANKAHPSTDCQTPKRFRIQAAHPSATHTTATSTANTLNEASCKMRTARNNHAIRMPAAGDSAHATAANCIENGKNILRSPVISKATNQANAVPVQSSICRNGTRFHNCIATAEAATATQYQ